MVHFLNKKIRLNSLYSMNSSVFIGFFPSSSIFIICFSNALPRGEYANLALLLFYFDLKVVLRYLYLSILLGDA